MPKKLKDKAPPIVLTEEQIYDAAQWYFYKWLSNSALAGISLSAPTTPEPGEI